jgi:hypothetical protein
VVPSLEEALDFWSWACGVDVGGGIVNVVAGPEETLESHEPGFVISALVAASDPSTQVISSCSSTPPGSSIAM